MITSQEIMKQIDDALKQFGDVGGGQATASFKLLLAQENVDMHDICKELKSLPNDDIIRILKEVESNHKNPHPFLCDVAMELINIEEGEDAKMDELAKDEFWDEYY